MADFRLSIVCRIPFAAPPGSSIDEPSFAPGERSITCALRAGQQVSTNEVIKVTSRSEFEPDAAGGGLTKWLMLEKLPDAGEQSDA